LIISAAEAQALLDLALAQPQPSENLDRAVRVLQSQLRWLRDGHGDKPTTHDAVNREWYQDRADKQVRW
jgi:hypothetical protein